MSDQFTEDVIQRSGGRGVSLCPYCGERYRRHPGFADHRDRCRLRPMNRPHISGTATAVYNSHE